MNEEKEIRFIDLFSGIGGFRLGLERAGGFRCVWSCDNNKYANQIYVKQFGEAHHHSADIRGVDSEEIPDFDLLCAGFPCQSFSVAGKRQGFKDTRGTLFFEICRIAEAKRPSLLLLENVKGLLNHDGGRTFTVILQTLDELGYWIEWQVLNSKYIGVPQNRERVFIIGHLTGAKGSGQEVFPIGKIYKNGSKRAQVKKRRQIGATLSGESAGGGNARGNYVLTLREDATAIDSNYWKGPDQHDQRTIVVDFFNKSVKEDTVFNTLKTSQGSPASSSVIAISSTNPRNSEEERSFHQSDVTRSVKPPYGNQQTLILHNIYGGFKEGVRVFNKSSPMIRTAKGGGHIPSVIADRTRTLAGKGRNLESPKLITNALSGIQKDNLLLENMSLRRLTPIECERLQGFPDHFTEGVSDSQRYRALGNAVTVNVIEFLGKQIKRKW